MHPSRDSGLFWRARPSRTRERRGCGCRAEFRAFSHFGVVFPVSDDDAQSRCVLTLPFLSRFSQQQEEEHSEEEEEEEEHEDGALVRFASRFGSEEDDVL